MANNSRGPVISAPTSPSRRAALNGSRNKLKQNPKVYRASIWMGGASQLPSDFVSLAQQLERSLGMPLWFIIQNRRSGEENCEHWYEIGQAVSDAFCKSKHQFQRNKPVALVLDSPGGFARNAYQLANFIRKHCGSFTAVVPQYAKSAATLIALGGKEIILGEDAELGPLDAQHFDSGREEYRSALDEVQSLERLFASALEAVDQSMQLLVNRTQKKVDALLAPTLHFVAEMMEPMMAKIDTVHYTQTSRTLKVAEEYALRLLVPQYHPLMAKRIARHLVEKYPEHGFVIDWKEAATFGLRTKLPTAEQAEIFDKMMPHLNKLTVIGKVEEATP